MQLDLVDLGKLMGYVVQINRSIGCGFKPDVLWYTLDPDRDPAPGAPFVFGIELNTSAAALTKSMARLKHGANMWAPQLFLLVPRTEAAKSRLTGAFHEIAKRLRIVDLEKCPTGDLRERACTLEIRRDHL